MDKLPKLAILGYGKMGKAVEESARKQGLEITEIFDIDTPIKPNGQYNFDIAIDFSTPNSVIENVKIVSEMGKDIVIGTTGWYDKLSVVETIINCNSRACVYASNFSIGMNIFFKIVERASALINNYSDFDVMINEIHHKNKIDHPSGTALSLADIVLENIDRKKQVVSEIPKGKAIKPEDLDVSYSRIGSQIGNHSIIIDSEVDTITLNHNAKSRTGFANGAVFAAKWLHGKTGLHSFIDIV